MRAIAVDWLSHWILIFMGGTVGIVWSWWGLLGFIIGWTMVNLVYRLGAASKESGQPHAS